MSDFNDNFAYFNALWINGIIYYAWCYAVYLGKNPVPGGVINVFRGFDKILPFESIIPL